MDDRPIGVFDSGLGGLTTVRELCRLLPEEDIVYFGDTGRVPYGSRSRETIVKYARQDVAFLRTFDLKTIVIACGTVSTTALDVLAATFPAGTVSGAPKVRAMEIIAETEQLPRGPYAGCIGWLGLDDGNVSLDTGITIRSMWVKDGRIHWQAGAGIVYDSDPAAEWQECMNKGKIIDVILKGEDHVSVH